MKSIASNRTLEIDKVYVLSVKTFKDRIQHIEQELKKHQIPFEFIFDHDIIDIDPKLELEIFGKEPQLAAPQRSLVLKHIQAWKNCLENQFQKILVLEDDVILHKNFKEDFNKVIAEISKQEEGYLVFLGGADTRVPREFFLEKSAICKNPIATTDGYITDFSACQKRLSWLTKNNAKLPSDHLLKKIDPELGIHQYWSTHALVEQGSVLGLFQSTLDGKRKTQSNRYNAIRYRFKIFTRRTLPGFFYRLLHTLGK